MASFDAGDAELARLTGPELVGRLRTTYRSEDYKAAARVLLARDHRLAEAEAALAEAKEGLEARERKLAEAEAALAEAKEGLGARDRRLVEADAALTEAKVGMDARERKLAEAEAALAEAKVGVDARDRKLAESGAALAKAMVSIDALERRLAKAREGLDAHDRMIAKANERIHERDLRLAEAEAALAGAKEGLDVRDRKLAQMQDRLTTALAEVGSLKERYDPLKDAHRGPVSDNARDGPKGDAACPGGVIASPVPAPHGEQRADVAEEKGPHIIDLCRSDDEDEPEGCRGFSRKRKVTASLVSDEGRRAIVSRERNVAASACSSDDEDDTLTLSQLMKKMRNEAQPGADGEPKNVDSVGASRDCMPEVSLAINKEAIEATAGACEEPNVASFVQGRGNVRSGEDGGGISSEVPSPQPLDSAVGNNSLKNPSRANSARHLANNLPEMPHLIKEEPVEAIAGGSGETKLANFLQGRANCRTAKDGGVSRELLSLPAPGFPAMTRLEKILSKANHVGVRIAGEEGSVGIHLPKTPVIMEHPETRVPGSEEMAAFVHGRGNRKSVDNGGVSRAKLSSVPPGFAPRISSQKNLSKADHGDPRIAESDGGQLQTSDKQLGSATMLPKIEPCTGSTSVDGLLPVAVSGNWKYESDVFTSCIEDKEICMQAACALYRQKKLMFQPAEGGQSGGGRLSESDAQRAAKLVEFLLDGNAHGPLKRTAEELLKHDSTAPSFLEKVVCQFYQQLFCIFQNKEDPYFR